MAATAGSTSFAEGYNYLTTHIVPGPRSPSWLLPPLLLFIALLIHPRHLSHDQLRWTLFPLSCACLAHAWRAMGGVDVLTVTTALWSFALLGPRDARVKFRQLRPRWSDAAITPTGGSTTPADVDAGSATAAGEGDAATSTAITAQEYPDTFGWRRVCWLSSLLVSLRLTGWEIGDAKHDRAQYRFYNRTPSKWQWGDRTRHVLCYIVIDTVLIQCALAYVPRDAYFFDEGVAIDSPLRPLMNDDAQTDWLGGMLIQSHIPPRIPRTVVAGALAFGFVTLSMYLPMLPALLLNALGVLPDAWSPHTWPPLYGSVSAVGRRGLAGFWGEFWHQNTRETMQTPGRALADMLGLRQQGKQHNLSRYACVVAVSFFLSGVMHTGVIPPEPLQSVVSANRMRLAVAGFFWAQAVGIIVEECTRRLVVACMPQRLQRPWLGAACKFAFAIIWLGLCLPLLVTPFRHTPFQSLVRL